MNVGFIGLGIMGRPMAENLLQAGHALFLKSGSRPSPAELAAAGGPAVFAIACSLPLSGLPSHTRPDTRSRTHSVKGRPGTAS